MPLDDETAEELAIDILLWLAQKLDLMERFLKLSGIPGDRVRQMLGERKFYGGLLGFILDHEPTLMSFCADTGHGPMSVSRCYAHFVPVKSIAWT